MSHYCIDRISKLARRRKYSNKDRPACCKPNNLRSHKRSKNLSAKFNKMWACIENSQNLKTLNTLYSCLHNLCNVSWLDQRKCHYQCWNMKLHNFLMNLRGKEMERIHHNKFYRWWQKWCIEGNQWFHKGYIRH